MTTDDTRSLPLALELAETQPLPTIESWSGGGRKSNSSCVNFGLIQVDDVQIDELDVF